MPFGVAAFPAGAGPFYFVLSTFYLVNFGSWMGIFFG
jgi:hypothetical protein